MTLYRSGPSGWSSTVSERRFLNSRLMFFSSGAMAAASYHVRRPCALVVDSTKLQSSNRTASASGWFVNRRPYGEAVFAETLFLIALGRAVDVATAHIVALDGIAMARPMEAVVAPQSKW